MMGLVSLEEEEETPEFSALPHEVTVKKQPSASQEESLHPELNLPAP